MKEKEACNDHLNKLRKNWIESQSCTDVINGGEISTTKELVIAGKKFSQEIYTDFSGDQRFVIFEVWRKQWFGFESHSCLGVEFLPNEDVLLLTNEQLWSYGIP